MGISDEASADGPWPSAPADPGRDRPGLGALKANSSGVAAAEAIALIRILAHRTGV